MRTITTAQQGALGAGVQAEHLRIYIKDAGGTWRDLTVYPGFNAVRSASWSDKVDSPHVTAEITLIREAHKLSLAPLMTNSALNRAFNPSASYGALIALNREVIIEVAVTPLDKAPGDGDWFEVFRGRVDDFDQASSSGEIQISCRDLGGRLAQQYIKTELVYAYAQDGGSYVPLRVWEPQIAVVLNQTYCLPASRGSTDPGGNKFFKCSQSGTTGTSEPTWTTGTNIVDGTARWNYVGAPTASGVPVQNVMQNILNDHKAATDPAVTLYTPTSPGWAIKQFIQKREFVLGAISSLAKQIGWEAKYKWRAATSQFELTLSQPNRSSPSVVYTFAPSEYADPTRLGVSIAEIRNAWRIVYSDASDLWPDGQPKRKTIEVSDATSITKYGELWAEIQEDSASNIDTSTEATALVNAALADCKEPTAELAVDLLRGFPWVEVNDFYTFQANGLHFDNAQSLAVTAWTNTYEGGRLKTSLTLRGAPTLGALSWIAVTVHPLIPIPYTPPPVQHFNGRETPLITLTLEVGGVFGRVVDTIDRRHLDQEIEVHLLPAPGTPVSASTLKTVIRGRDFSIGDLTPGATYTMRTVPRWLDPSGRTVRGQPSPEQTFTAGRASTAHLEDLAVTEGKLGNLAVATGKLQDLAVSGGKLADLAVSGVKLADLAVSTGKLADLAVSGGKLADLAVSTGKLADLAVSEGKLGALSVTEGKLGALSVTEGKLGALAVTEGKLGALAVTEGKLGALAVTNGKIGNLAVDGGKIAALAVSEAKLADGAVATAKLADLSVATGKLQTSAVTSEKILAKAVTNAKLGDASVTIDKADLGVAAAIWDEGRGQDLGERFTGTNGVTSYGPDEGSSQWVKFNISSGATDAFVYTDIICLAQRTNIAVVTYRCRGTGWDSNTVFRIHNQSNYGQSATAPMITDGLWHTAVIDISAFTTTGTIRVDFQDDKTFGTGAIIDISYVGTGMRGASSGASQDTTFKEGKTGLGVYLPAEKLDVLGNVKLTGSIVAPYSHVRATQATAGSYANGATMIWGTEEWDTLGEYNNATGLFTAQVAGYYSISAAIFCASLSYNLGNSVQLQLRKNGTGVYAYGYRWYAASTASWYATTAIITTVYLAVGNTVDFYIGHDRAGGNVSLFTDNPANYLAINRLV